MAGMVVRFRLRAYRTGKVGLRALARATGIAASTLSHLERNQTVRLELDTLDRIITYFRAHGYTCEVSDLLAYHESDEEHEHDG